MYYTVYYRVYYRVYCTMYHTVYCTVYHTVYRTVQYAIPVHCSVCHTVYYTLHYTVYHTLNYSTHRIVLCAIQCTAQCAIEYTVGACYHTVYYAEYLHIGQPQSILSHLETAVVSEVGNEVHCGLSAYSSCILARALMSRAICCFGHDTRSVSMALVLSQMPDSHWQL